MLSLSDDQLKLVSTCQQNERRFIVVYKKNDSGKRVLTAPTFQTITLHNI